MGQRFFEMVPDEFGDMLRGWIELRKCFHLVEVAVIKFIDYFVDVFFQHFEVNAHTEVVELSGADRNGNPPVVPVRQFAAARVIPQMMAA